MKYANQVKPRSAGARQVSQSGEPKATPSEMAVGMIGGAMLGASVGGPVGAVFGGIGGALLISKVPPKPSKR